MTPRRRRGRWVVDVHFRNPDGTTTRVQKVSPIQTEPAARVYERQVLSALARGDYKAATKECPTVEKFQEEFLRVSKDNDKASNLKSKKDALRKHIVPLLGAVRLDEVGTAHFEKLKRGMLELELAEKTVNNVMSVLSSMLRLGKDYKHVRELPSVKWLRVKRHEEPALTAEEFERLVTAADPEWRTMMRFAVLTGLRLGELCDLKWSHLDLDGGWVRVRQAVYRGESDTPKHGKTRDVPLHPSLVPLLKASRRPGVAYVFATAEGKQLDAYNQPTVAMARAGRRAGLGRPVGWHELRRTWASWLGSAGVPARTLMALGGWGSLSMVERYVRLDGQDLRGAIARLGEAPAAKRETT